ncbi:MAG: metal-dependent phosphohydrolase [Actinomycetes bacterium]
MTSPEVELRRVWQRTAGRGHDASFEGLLERHRDPRRRYHTATHVMWVCRHVDRLAAHHDEIGRPLADPDAVRMAALFHDAIYEPASATNESDSARLADARLADLGWASARRAEVARLVELTAGHTVDADDLAGAVLLDADLAILGSDANEYAHYATAVRAEYAHVTDDAWRTGRARVLSHFLDRPTIYATEPMRAEREHRARANLAAELAQLTDT